MRDEFLNDPVVRVRAATQHCQNGGNLLIGRDQFRWAFPPPTQQDEPEPERLQCCYFVSCWNVAAIADQAAKRLDDFDDELFGDAEAIILAMRPVRPGMPR